MIIIVLLDVVVLVLKIKVKISNKMYLLEINKMSVVIFFKKKKNIVSFIGNIVEFLLFKVMFCNNFKIIIEIFIIE